MRKSLNRKVAAIAVGAVVVASAGTAYAYWTTTGSGTGAASTGTSSAFEVTTDTATGGPLTPGGPSQTVAFHVKNTNSGVQRLQSVTVTVANASTAWTSGGCSAADFTVATPSFSAGDVAPGATTSGSVVLSMNNLSTSQDDCKAVTVPLRVVVG